MNHVLAAYYPLAVYMLIDLSFQTAIQALLSAGAALLTIAIARNAIPAVWRQEYMALVPLAVAGVFALSLMTTFQLYVDLWDAAVHLIDPAVHSIAVPPPSPSPRP